MPAFKKLKKNKKSKSNPNGAPTKLTEEMIAEMCKFLRAGAFVESSAILAGISKKTFYEYIKLSYTKKRTKHADLCRKLRNAVGAAQEEASMRDLLNIDRCAMGAAIEYKRYPEGSFDTETGENVSGRVETTARGIPIINRDEVKADWKASAWRLEKRQKKLWGQSSTVTIEQKDPLENQEEEDDPNKIELFFVKPDGSKEDVKL